MLKKGQKAPSLSAGPNGSVQTIDGRTLSLDELGRDGPVMLVLLRGFSRPYSRKHLGQMRDDYNDFSSLGAEVVVVTRHDQEEMRDYWTRHKLPFVGIADPDGKITSRFSQQWKLLRLGRMPAQFVLDCRGSIALAHYGRGMSDILSNDRVLTVLRTSSERAGCPPPPARAASR